MSVKKIIDPDTLVLHVGCGLDSRCNRVEHECTLWVDCDFPDVLAIRSKYYTETEKYRLMPLDASKPEKITSLPGSDSAILILEGISMYLKTEHSFTPDHLVDKLKSSDRRIFRFLFTGTAYRKIYRLYELN